MLQANLLRLFFVTNHSITSKSKINQKASMKRQFNVGNEETIADVSVSGKRSCPGRNKKGPIKSLIETGNSHRNNDSGPVESILSCPEFNGIVSHQEICEEPAVVVGDRNSYSVERVIEDAIISLAKQRGEKKTLCPSEIPRLILKYKNWRDYMDLTRKVAFRMARSGIVDITQKGIKRDANDFESIRGPIRLQLHRSEQTVESP